MPEVTVGVVAYKAREQLQKCISSLMFSEVDYHLIVLDNSPPDHETRKYLLERKQLGDEMTLIIPEKNIGFGPAYNRIFALCETPYFLVLNPDCYVPKKWLEPLVTCMWEHDTEEHPVGIVGCYVRNPDGSPQRQGVAFKPDGEPFDMVINDWPNGKPFAYEAQAISAVCFLVRKQVIDEIQFNEVYGLGYFEDVAFSFDVRRKGYSVWWTPDIEVTHEAHSSWKGEDKKLLNDVFQENLKRFLEANKGFIIPNDQWFADKVLR